MIIRAHSFISTSLTDMVPEQINLDEVNLNTWGKDFQKITPGLKRIFDEFRIIGVVNQDFCKPFIEDRLVGIEALDQFNLPRYKRLSMPLIEYLKNPEKYLRSLDTDSYYVSLNPYNKQLKRERRVRMSAEEIMPFITEYVGEKTDQFDILILQYFENLYGGNILIAPDNSMIIEFREGYQGPIGSGSETPQFTGGRDVFTGNFFYSFEDPKLRQLIYDTVQTIPHHQGERDKTFLPGYYEFVIVRNRLTQELEPKFIDLKRNLAEIFDSNIAYINEDHRPTPLREHVKQILENAEITKPTPYSSSNPAIMPLEKIPAVSALQINPETTVLTTPSVPQPDATYVLRLEDLPKCMQETVRDVQKAMQEASAKGSTWEKATRELARLSGQFIPADALPQVQREPSPRPECERETFYRK
jgi:hypothetical protein